MRKAFRYWLKRKLLVGIVNFTELAKPYATFDKAQTRRSKRRLQERNNSQRQNESTEGVDNEKPN